MAQNVHDIEWLSHEQLARLRAFIGEDACFRRSLRLPIQISEAQEPLEGS